MIWTNAIYLCFELFIIYLSTYLFIIQGYLSSLVIFYFWAMLFEFCSVCVVCVCVCVCGLCVSEGAHIPWYLCLSIGGELQVLVFHFHFAGDELTLLFAAVYVS